jgi:hypothetical protein
MWEAMQVRGRKRPHLNKYLAHTMQCIGCEGFWRMVHVAYLSLLSQNTKSKAVKQEEKKVQSHQKTKR